MLRNIKTNGLSAISQISGFQIFTNLAKIEKPITASQVVFLAALSKQFEVFVLLLFC